MSSRKGGISAPIDTDYEEHRGYRITGDEPILGSDSERHHLSTHGNEPVFPPMVLQRRRDEEDGVRGTQYEESPIRDPA